MTPAAYRPEPIPGSQVGAMAVRSAKPSQRPAPMADTWKRTTLVDKEVALTFSGKGTLGQQLPAATHVKWTLVRTFRSKSIQRTLKEEGRPHSYPSQLILGDNLVALVSLDQPDKLRGRVQLVYIDPPFATGAVFKDRSSRIHYSDNQIGAAYLEALRARLELLRDLLADDGSIYLHLDSRMVAYGKILMDEVFGVDNFRSMITRQKCNSKNFTSRQFGDVADYLLYYSKSDSPVWNAQWDPWTAERLESAEFRFKDEETGRQFKPVPIHAPGRRRGASGQPWRGMNPPHGKHWMYTPAQLDEFDSRGEIYWSKNGNPRRKVYLDTRPGASVTNIWTGLKDPMNQHSSVTGYPTEKNQALLERIVAASSTPGGIVLDCYMGSGTTCAAAEKLGRPWVGIDLNGSAVDLAAQRLSRQIEEAKSGHSFEIWAVTRTDS